MIYGLGQQHEQSSELELGVVSTRLVFGSEASVDPHLPWRPLNLKVSFQSTGDLDVSRHLAVPALSTYIQWKMEDDHT